MDKTVMPSGLSGSLTAIPSKSDVHRALICAAFADAPTVISCNLLSEDIRATVRCLCAAGAEIAAEEKKGLLQVTPIPKKTAQEGTDSREEVPELFCGESGSTLRFLVPVMAAAGKEVCFTGAGELPNRPLAPLLSVLRAHGVCCRPERLPMRICGRLSGDSFSIAGNISSQYISGLLMAAPLLSQEIQICLTSKLESSAYVDMTVDTMRRFGVQAERTENGWRIPAGSYHTPGSYPADGDWSNAAFWLCAARMQKRSISVLGLREDSLQGDRAIAALLAERFTDADTETTLRTIDASEIPDLVPILAALAAVSPGTTDIVHAERLRLKECDRLSAVSEMLRAMGAEVTEHADGLSVRGVRQLRGGCRVNGHNDHRIVMTAAVLASVCEKEVTISDAEAVRKSYPRFWADFEQLGGKTDGVSLW